jgi:predicted nucleotidyltransferase
MADRYTYDQFEGLMARSRGATLEELAEARDYLILILQTNNVLYAFMGGYSLVLRGSPRPTSDIDIAIQVNQLELRAVVTPQSR